MAGPLQTCWSAGTALVLTSALGGQVAIEHLDAVGDGGGSSWVRMTERSQRSTEVSRFSMSVLPVTVMTEPSRSPAMVSRTAGMPPALYRFTQEMSPLGTTLQMTGVWT